MGSGRNGISKKEIVGAMKFSRIKSMYLLGYYLGRVGRVAERARLRKLAKKVLGCVILEKKRVEKIHGGEGRREMIILNGVK